MWFHLKIVSELPAAPGKEGRIRSKNISLKDLKAEKVYFAQNGFPTTLIHFSFHPCILKELKNNFFREEFQKLINIVNRSGYEGSDHKNKKGIVLMKNSSADTDDLLKYKMKAPGNNLEIYGFFEPVLKRVIFEDFYLRDKKAETPNKKLHYRIMRHINRQSF